MGASISAFIEIDDNTPKQEQPFTNDCSVWDLGRDIGLSGCKDYAFFSAIAGVRNSGVKKPIIEPRGLPPQASELVRKGLDGDDKLAVGWLTLTEINGALAHMDVRREMLAGGVLMVLEVMECIERRYGMDRVRLVFGFSD